MLLHLTWWSSEMKVSARFADTFRIVAEHYGASPEEVREMKELAREHLDDAQRSYEAMRTEIDACAQRSQP
jgi:hypothetical protein